MDLRVCGAGVSAVSNTNKPAGGAHTPGPVKAVTWDDSTTSPDFFIHTADNTVIARVFNVTDRRNGNRSCEHEANAALIAEAFNVSTETGFTPRMLAEQRAQLVEALREAEDLLCAARKELTLDVLMRMKGTINRAQNALSLATKGAA